MEIGVGWIERKTSEILRSRQGFLYIGIVYIRIWTYTCTVKMNKARWNVKGYITIFTPVRSDDNKGGVGYKST